RLIEVLAQSRLPETPGVIVDALRDLLKDPDVRVSAAAVKAAASLQPKALDESLLAVISNTRYPAAARLDALRAVISRHPRLDARAFELVTSRLGPDASPVDRLTAVSLLAAAQLDEVQGLEVVERIGKDAVVSPSTVLPALAKVQGERFRAALV